MPGSSIALVATSDFAAVLALPFDGFAAEVAATAFETLCRLRF